MNRHGQFKRIYKKFIDGSRWLSQKTQDGTITEKDREDFNRLVANPMDEVWLEFSEEERAQWSAVMYAVDLFEGTIILEDQEHKRVRMEERKKRNRKRWRSYFQQY